jgi:UDP-N-acetylmuramoylalanine--D-glutamate ligase
LYCRIFAEQAPGKVVKFSSRKSPIKKSDVKIPGDHNFLNATAAALAAKISGASMSSIKKTLKTFNGLPHRQEIVAIKNKITYINDTTATTPDGAIAAIKTFCKKGQTLRMIIGGADKELEFDELARVIKQYRVDAAVLPGTAYAKLSKSLKVAKVKYKDVSGLKEAVDYLVGNADSGDVIILSPACASFGLFKNEFDRGEQLKKLINKP